MSENYDLVVNKKAKSAIWNHFWIKFDKTSQTVNPGIAVCRHCNNDVKNAGGTTNLTTHMTRHHPRLLSHTTSTKPKVDKEADSSKPNLPQFIISL